jgi:hypothetical protein
LLGTLAFVIAGTPGLLLVLLATTGLERPMLAPALLLVWSAICAAVSAGLFTVAARVFERRRENLGMIA